MTDTPALDLARFNKQPIKADSSNPPRFLLLHGSTRPNSFTSLLVGEAARLLQLLGGEVRLYDPTGLPTPDGPRDHPKVKELHDALLWSEAQLWCTPENYGTVSAVLKLQLDWAAPPVLDGKPFFANRPVAVTQVCGGPQSFAASITLATIARWLGMVVTPTQYSIGKVQDEFDADKRLKPGPNYDLLVDVVEELFKLTVLLRAGALADRYSKRTA